jgi:hypothetical protein
MKGSIFDPFFVFATLFFISTFILMIAAYLSEQYVTMIEAQPIVTNSTIAMMTSLQGTFQFYDYIIAALVFISIGFTWILGYNIKANPLNFPIGLIVLIILTYLSFPLSNLNMQFLSMPPIGSVSPSFKFIIYIAANMPTILFVSTLIYLVVSVIGYAK